MAVNIADRREYKRHTIACLSRVQAGDQEGPRCKTINLSDGGMLLAVPAADLPARDAEISVHFSLPRRTANTYMLEEFACRARVVRHQMLKDDHLAALAVRFETPLKLAVEV